jgi:hypothetical protein
MTDKRHRCFYTSLLRATRLVLLGSAVPMAWFVTGEAQAAVEKPRDLKAARAAIEQADAKAQAARLEALAKDLTPLEREWGIKLLGVRLTAAGYALDFRYKVLDPKKAAPIVQRRFSPTPYLIVERTGAKLGVPFTDKAGSLRSSVTTAEQVRQGRNYTALFANPGKHVKPGDKVTVAFGNFRADHLIVQ